jgi:hypothetical protein
MHCKMKKHDVDQVGTSAVPVDYWNLSGKEKFHCTRRLYSVLAVSFLNYDPPQHSSVYDKFYTTVCQITNCHDPRAVTAGFNMESPYTSNLTFVQ